MVSKLLKKVTKKRIIFIFILLLLGLSVLLTDNIFIRIAAVLIIIIIISFIVFSKEIEQSPKSDTNDLDKSESDAESAATVHKLETKEQEILTSEDLKNYDNKIMVHGLLSTNLKEKFFEIACEKLPEKYRQDDQVKFLLSKILSVINITLMANSTIYFWYNKNKEQLVHESSYPIDSKLHKGKFNMSDDIVSKVIRNNSPEILNNINSNVEADVITYYTEPLGIKSVVAVPVYYNNDTIGALVVDSKSDDVFGYETVYLLGRYVKMISLILTVYDENYSEFLIKQKLEAVGTLINDSESYKTEIPLINNFISVVDKLIEFDACSVILADYIEKNFKIVKILNNLIKTSFKYPSENFVIDYENSMIGKTIQTAQSLIIEDITSIRLPVYSSAEPGNFSGSLLVIPIVFNGYVLGAIAFESLRKNFYSQEDAKFMTRVVKFVAYSLESIRLLNIVSSHMSKDLETSFMNKSEFEKRLGEEFSKAQESKTNIGLALLSIDKLDKIIYEYDQKIVPEIIKFLSDFMKKESEKLMLLARLETNKFAVIFYNTDDQSAYIWCEKIRQKILKEPLRLGESGKLISITLSIGYSAGKELKTEFSLLENSEKALKKASESGNIVKTIK